MVFDRLIVSDCLLSWDREPSLCFVKVKREDDLEGIGKSLSVNCQGVLYSKLAADALVWYAGTFALFSG